jgi:hypothetical protein
MAGVSFDDRAVNMKSAAATTVVAPLATTIDQPPVPPVSLATVSTRNAPSDLVLQNQPAPIRNVNIETVTASSLAFSDLRFVYMFIQRVCTSVYRPAKVAAPMMASSSASVIEPVAYPILSDNMSHTDEVYDKKGAVKRNKNRYKCDGEETMVLSDRVQAVVVHKATKSGKDSSTDKKKSAHILCKILNCLGYSVAGKMSSKIAVADTSFVNSSFTGEGDQEADDV